MFESELHYFKKFLKAYKTYLQNVFDYSEIKNQFSVILEQAPNEKNTDRVTCGPSSLDNTRTQKWKAEDMGRQWEGPQLVTRNMWALIPNSVPGSCHSQPGC